MNWLLFLCVIAVGIIPDPELNHWEIQTTWMFLFLILILSWKLSQKFHYLVGIVFVISASSGAFHYLFPKFFFYEFGPIAQASYGSVVAGSTLYLSLIACAFLLLSKSNNDKIGSSFVLLAIIDAFIISIRHSHYWVQSNPAMDATFIAICLPLVYGGFKDYKNTTQIKVLLALAMVISVIITESSTALMGLGSGMAVFLIFEYGGMAIFPVFLMGLGLALFGFHHLGREFLNTNGREHIWKITWEYFWRDVDVIWGTGTGAFTLYGPALQLAERTAKGLYQGGDTFVWLHNDWFQILFENGLLGLTSVSLLFVTMVWKARKRPALAASIVTFGASACTQMLLRFPITAMFGAYLIHATFIGVESEDCELLLPSRPQVTVKNFLGKTIQFFQKEEL